MSASVDKIKRYIKLKKIHRQFRKEVKRDLANRTSRDLAANKQTTPPVNENVEIHSVFITEAYPSSRVKNLRRSLKRLGWGVPNSSNSDLVAALDNARQSLRGESWANIGNITPQRPGNLSQRYAKLPAGVEYANGWMHTITPSLTLVTIQFVFDGETTQALDAPLRADYHTHLKEMPPTAVSFVEVPQQKRHAIEDVRKKLRERCSKWFKDNTPGSYASGQLGKTFPSVELITVRQFELEEVADKREDTYISMLGIDPQMLWKSSNNGALKLHFPDRSGDESYVFIGKYEDVTKEMREYGGADRNGLVSYLSVRYQKNITLWALSTLLLRYEQNLANMRDRAAKSTRWAGKALKDLEDVRNQLLTAAADTRSISEEVVELTGENGRYLSDTEAFEPPRALEKFYDKNLMEELKRGSKKRAGRLITAERQVRETALAGAELTSASANLRLQRHITWLTYIVIAAAIASVIIGIMQLNHDKEPSSSQPIQNNQQIAPPR